MWRASSMPVMPGIWTSISTICGCALDLRKRFRRIGRLAYDAMRKLGREIGQHFAQPRARWRFIVNDQDRCSV